MTTTTFHYIGQRYTQRSGGQETLLFLAPAEDISTWGGVPQKSSRFMKGFQRSDDESHWLEIAEFFEKEGNISPTAIVVAFKPNTIRVTPLDLKGIPIQAKDAPELVSIEINLEGSSQDPIEVLAEAVLHEFEQQELLEGLDDDSNDDSIDDDSDADDDEDDDDDEESNIEAEKDLRIHSSHLAQFVAFLKDDAALKLAAAEDEPRLRAMLGNLLKPATIVDGQHRTLGASHLEQSIPFPVVALLNADWREQVFQFVVINQRAKPIPSEFLSAIISSSLSPDDIQKISKRLEQAGVKLDNAKIIDVVHTDPRSPFQGMINFKIQGSSGALKYNGMLTLARRFRGLRTHNRNTRFSNFFKQIFQDGSEQTRYTDRRSEWLEHRWFPFFAAFWSEVKKQLCDEGRANEELWAYGSKLLKIVTLQELQNLFLEWVASRMEPVKDPSDLAALTVLFLKNIKPKFFERDWKLPSLQSGTGRKYLRSALDKARSNPQYKYKDPLFTGVEK